MKNRLPLLILMFFVQTSLNAQTSDLPDNPIELGFRLGSSHFLGDLGGQKGIGKPFLRDTEVKLIRPAFGVFSRWNVGHYFSFRLDLNYLQLSGDDRLAGNNKDYSPTIFAPDDAWFRWYRNLNFRSRVIESSVSVEIVPYTFRLNTNNELLPYGFLGLGIFNFNPQARYEGRWINLQPLSTEGQGIIEGKKVYKLTQFSIPMGLGVKWKIDGGWIIALEVNHRVTFTDYMDDVSTTYVDPQFFINNMSADKAAIAIAMAKRSIEIDPTQIRANISATGQQRGDPKDNDAYYSISFTLSRYLIPH